MAPADRPTLILDASVRDALLAHAGEGAPDEVCGILAGRAPSDTGDPVASDDTGDHIPSDEVSSDDTAADSRTVVSEHHPVDNVADRSRTRYELDPAETLATVQAVEAAGDDVVGFYHSHPRGPAAPSETDRERATWSGYVYAIVVPGGGIRAWRWTGEAFVELDVVVR